MSDEIDLMGVGGQLLGGLSLFLYGMEKMSHSANIRCNCVPREHNAHTETGRVGRDRACSVDAGVAVPQ